jgi:hypothetical protein
VRQLETFNFESRIQINMTYDVREGPVIGRRYAPSTETQNKNPNAVMKRYALLQRMHNNAFMNDRFCATLSLVKEAGGQLPIWPEICVMRLRHKPHRNVSFCLLKSLHLSLSTQPPQSLQNTVKVGNGNFVAVVSKGC